MRCLHLRTKIRNHEIVVCCVCHATLPKGGRPFKTKSGLEVMRSGYGKKKRNDDR
jgi:hypothetical protein